jgi:hypothetical protein
MLQKLDAQDFGTSILVLIARGIMQHNMSGRFLKIDEGFFRKDWDF